MQKAPALLLIDIQNFYFEHEGSRLDDAKPSALNARRVLQLFRELGLPVFHIAHRATFPECKPGRTEYLRRIYKEVEPLKSEPVIWKDYPSAFLETTLQKQLDEKHIDSLVIVGMMSQMCVSTTARAAQDHHYDVTVVHDACAAPALRFMGEQIPAKTVHAAHMAALEGFFATLKSTDELVDAFAYGEEA